MQITPIISTKRLIFTDITANDRDIIAATCSKTPYQRYLYLPENYSLQDADDFIEMCTNNTDFEENIVWALRLKNDRDSKLIGTLELRLDGEFGVWVVQNAFGKGYITEAVKGLMAYLHNLLYIENVKSIKKFVIPRIIKHVGENINIASSRVAYKLGFTYTGVKLIPDKIVDGEVKFKASRYHIYTKYQNSSEFELVNYLELDVLRTANDQNSAWPALIKYASDYATDIECFFDKERGRLDSDHSRVECAKILLDRIGIGNKYTDCTPQSKAHTLTPLYYNTLLEIAAIPYGKTVSYSDIDPIKPRIVGNICKYNPFPLIIPCHRVLPKAGSAGSFAFGVKAKDHYLELEQ